MEWEFAWAEWCSRQRCWLGVGVGLVLLRIEAGVGVYWKLAWAAVI